MTSTPEQPQAQRSSSIFGMVKSRFKKTKSKRTAGGEEIEESSILGPPSNYSQEKADLNKQGINILNQVPSSRRSSIMTMFFGEEEAAEVENTEEKKVAPRKSYTHWPSKRLEVTPSEDDDDEKEEATTQAKEEDVVEEAKKDDFVPVSKDFVPVVDDDGEEEEEEEATKEAETAAKEEEFVQIAKTTACPPDNEADEEQNDNAAEEEPNETAAKEVDGGEEKPSESAEEKPAEEEKPADKEKPAEEAPKKEEEKADKPTQTGDDKKEDDKADKPSEPAATKEETGSSDRPPVLIMKYLALPNGLGGRGGTQRYFMLANNIPFMEELIELSVWGATEKDRLVDSGENPNGTLPVTYTTGTKDSKDTHLNQHIATCRYLSRLHNITKENEYWDMYVQDLVADEYQGYRETWVQAAFSTDFKEKKEYAENVAPKFLSLFEALYAKYKLTDTFLSLSKTTGQPLWGDAAIYGMLHDNLLTGFVCIKDLKTNFPNLFAMYEAYGNIETVKEWNEGAALADKKQRKMLLGS